MNKAIVSFGLGLVVGAIGGVLGSKWFYKRKNKKSDKEEYEEYVGEYQRVPHDDEVCEAAPPDKEEFKAYKKAEEEAVEANEEKVPYNEMYALTREEAREENVLKELQSAREEHLRRIDDPPEIISEEEAQNMSANWQEEPLYYYMGDHTLVDDFDHVISDPDIILGDCLTVDGFIREDDERDHMWVKNWATEIVYWIQKFEEAWSEEDHEPVGLKYQE